MAIFSNSPSQPVITQQLLNGVTFWYNTCCKELTMYIFENLACFNFKWNWKYGFIHWINPFCRQIPQILHHNHQSLNNYSTIQLFDTRLAATSLPCILWRIWHASSSNEIKNKVSFLEITAFVGHFLKFSIPASYYSITIERWHFLIQDLLQGANHVYFGEFDMVQLQMKSKIRIHSLN